ncbi:hypothetical protein J3A83DRAFT_4109575, partial [Scleroderma citrinum]
LPQPMSSNNRSHHLSVIHVDATICAMHLIPIFNRQHIPQCITFHNSLDLHCGFYINHFMDHHTFELCST